MPNFNALGNLLSPELTARHNQRDERTRRAVYVFGFTALFGVSALAITLMGLQGPVPERAVEGFLGLIQLMIIFFLSTTTIDRSEVLSNIGHGIRARGEAAAVQTPSEAKGETSAG